MTESTQYTGQVINMSSTLGLFPYHSTIKEKDDFDGRRSCGKLKNSNFDTNLSGFNCIENPNQFLLSSFLFTFFFKI